MGEDGWRLPWEGSCRCGTVRFRISEAPLIASVCHCRGCQKMTGGAFSTTYAIPEAGFAVTAGATVTGGVPGGPARHEHCDTCKSWLFTRVDPAMGGFVNVRATMLDDAGWFVPFLETQTAEKLPWATTPAVRSYPRFPDERDYPGLIADYRDHGRRPGGT